MTSTLKVICYCNMFIDSKRSNKSNKTNPNDIKPKDKASNIEVYSNIKSTKTVKEKSSNRHEKVDKQKAPKDREHMMSFGPLMKEDNTSNPKQTSLNKEVVSSPTKPLNVKAKIGKDDGKTKDEEGNLSLLSYEDTDSEDDKYYNEEELTSNMGITDLDKIK